MVVSVLLMWLAVFIGSAYRGSDRALVLSESVSEHVVELAESCCVSGLVYFEKDADSMSRTWLKAAMSMS